MSDLTIEDLQPSDEDAVQQCAAILVEAFRGHTDAWPDLPSALETVRESFEGAASRIARDADGRVVGWVGALSDYDGHAWEVHPLAVAPDAQRRGIGRRLVADIETLAAAGGANTLWLGTDDEDGRTSLGGVDPYPDPLAALAAIPNRGGHPYEFYQRCGFVLVGMLPDANGPGKPDIFTAKRLTPTGPIKG
ncbi:MAG: GNAT family N-acetyltransferase [Dehalococcoidia bacterium]|nr:GNAT family N-acetyltransferase [Dehalococcoidia bacterium]